MRLVRTQGLIQNLPEADKQFGQSGFTVVVYTYTHMHIYMYVCVYIKTTTLIFPLTYCSLYTEI